MAVVNTLVLLVQKRALNLLLLLHRYKISIHNSAKCRDRNGLRRADFLEDQYKLRVTDPVNFLAPISMISKDYWNHQLA